MATEEKTTTGKNEHDDREDKILKASELIVITNEYLSWLSPQELAEAKERARITQVSQRDTRIPVYNVEIADQILEGKSIVSMRQSLISRYEELYPGQEPPKDIGELKHDVEQATKKSEGR